MLANSLARTLSVLGLSVWVICGVIIGQILASILIVSLPFALHGTVEATASAALGYLFALSIVVALPLIIRKHKADFTQLGLYRLPSWSDIGLGLLSVLPYFLLASSLLWLGTDILHIINPEVGQQISFSNLHSRGEYILAFFTLVVIAPFAEEFLFRGYFQGAVMKRAGKIAGILVVAAVFGLFHLPGFTEQGVVWQWGAAADTFSLGIIAGMLRLLTGSIWAGMILHALKNGIAYYFLFIAR